MSPMFLSLFCCLENKGGNHVRDPKEKEKKKRKKKKMGL
jgi:hypothetical protein